MFNSAAMRPSQLNDCERSFVCTSVQYSAVLYVQSIDSLRLSTGFREEMSASSPQSPSEKLSLSGTVDLSNAGATSLEGSDGFGDGDRARGSAVGDDDADAAADVCVWLFECECVTVSELSLFRITGASR